MQLMVALKPIHDAAGIERLIVSTYQSVSGTGVKAVEELEHQTHTVLHGQPVPEPEIYPHPIAFNVLGGAGQLRRRRRPHGRRAQDDVRDAQDPRRRVDRHQRHLRARAGAQLALGVGHARDARPALRGGGPRAARAAPGADHGRRPGRPTRYPTALNAAGRDDVFVGRLRRDPSHERGLCLWVVSDNLLKGAATNAIQIAEVLHARNLVRVPSKV